MVTVNFRMSAVGKVALDLAGPEPWRSLVGRLAPAGEIDAASCIAVRRGVVLKGEDLVHDGDEVDVFPAISGG